jgi:pimeloyl-ACP methyl ester carboxylesterase
MSAQKLRFVQVAGRRVTWRAAGTGPAAVLLHGSPQSSKALAGLADAVAEAGLCAIMPDTPGAGFSEPLAKDDLTIPDLAQALLGFVDAIGLQKFALYGTHTGAAIASVFAARYPERVSALVLDGLAAWTDAERAHYRDTYAPPFVPVWDGSHLTWLWSRMEAQSLFFPWHQHNAATWRGVNLSPPWHLHRNAMDMLSSGDAYRAIYQASLAFVPAEFLPSVGPTQLIMAASDVLRTHAARPSLNHLPLALYEQPAALWQAIAAALAAGPGNAAPVFPASGLFWRGTLAGSGKPNLLLHPAGASSRVFEPELLSYAAQGPVVAFDIPGHGFDESEMPGTAKEIAEIIKAECHALGLEDFTVSGQRFGAVIARAVSADAIELGSPSTDPDLATQGAVNLDPVWDGTHLQRAWRVASRQAIFDPWYKPEAANARQSLGDLTPAAIHAAAVDLLRAGPAWARAVQIEAS